MELPWLKQGVLHISISIWELRRHKIYLCRNNARSPSQEEASDSSNSGYIRFPFHILTRLVFSAFLYLAFPFPSSSGGSFRKLMAKAKTIPVPRITGLAQVRIFCNTAMAAECQRQIDFIAQHFFNILQTLCFWRWPLVAKNTLCYFVLM